MSSQEEVTGWIVRQGSSTVVVFGVIDLRDHACRYSARFHLRCRLPGAPSLLSM